MSLLSLDDYSETNSLVPLNQHDIGYGTSFAAPVVSGVLGKLRRVLFGSTLTVHCHTTTVPHTEAHRLPWRTCFRRQR